MAEASIKRTADRGLLYEVTQVKDGANDKVLDNGDDTVIKTWYRIKAKAANGSEIPDDLSVDDLWSPRKVVTLSNGDELYELKIEKLCFANEVVLNFSRDRTEYNRWCDTNKGYVVSKLAGAEGNLSGHLDPDNEFQMKVFAGFIKVTEQKKDHTVIKRPVVDPKVTLLHSILEDAPTPHREMWRYMPLIIDSIDAPASQSEVVPFTCNFALDGSAVPAPQLITIQN